MPLSASLRINHSQKDRLFFLFGVVILVYIICFAHITSRLEMTHDDHQINPRHDTKGRGVVVVSFPVDVNGEVNVPIHLLAQQKQAIPLPPSPDLSRTTTSRNGTSKQNEIQQHEQQQQQPKIHGNGGRIANFLLAGTQKGGTTALAMYLMNQLPSSWICHPHPQPGLPHTVKESHFFDWPHLYNQGLPGYQYLFRKCRESTPIYMDATPADMLYPIRVARIYQQLDQQQQQGKTGNNSALAQLKVLFLLREPASRELSWYRHLYRESVDGKCSSRSTNKSQKNKPPATPAYYQETICLPNGTLQTFADRMSQFILPRIPNSTVYTNTFTRADADADADMNKKNNSNNSILMLHHRYHERGLYAKWLQQWFQVLPSRRQVWVANYHDEMRNQTDFIRRVHEFLQLPAVPYKGLVRLPKANHKHAKHETLPSCDLQRFYYQTFQRHNQALYRLLNQTRHEAPTVERPFVPFAFECTT